MKNLKDKLSTVLGIVGAVAGSVILVSTSGIALPVAMVIGAKGVGIFSASILAYLMGKNPDGTKKVDEQIENEMRPKIEARK